MTDNFKQAKALYLADRLWDVQVFHPSLDDCGEAAKELRRLYVVNQKMLETLKRLQQMCADFGAYTACDVAEAAIVFGQQEGH